MRPSMTSALPDAAVGSVAALKLTATGHNEEALPKSTKERRCGFSEDP